MKVIRNKKESLVLGKVLQKVAPRIGAAVLMEPEWGISGRITFKSGKHSYFHYSTLDLNPVGGAAVARDKDYSNFFIKKLGFPVVPNSKVFFSSSWGAAIGAPEQNIDAAFTHAQKITFPVIVKPNSGTQGVGVALVHTKRDFYRAMKTIFKRDNVAMVQSVVSGRDYRVVVLDGEIISAYEREPLSVTGDGKSTIETLLKRKQTEFVKRGRDTRIDQNDIRLITKLRRQGLSPHTVLEEDRKVFLLDNANLSTGGEATDVTDHVHPQFKRIAVEVTKGMGLRLCGVDLIINGSIENSPGQYWVIEINSSPGLDHYVTTGRRQRQIVENLYFTILKHIES
jgi:D-alanine-D-alanine ligase-like ATP-grasp enzyme